MELVFLDVWGCFGLGVVNSINLLSMEAFSNFTQVLSLSSLFKLSSNAVLCPVISL